MPTLMTSKALRIRLYASALAACLAVAAGCEFIAPPTPVRLVPVKVSVDEEVVLEGSFGVPETLDEQAVWNHFVDESRNSGRAAMLRPTEAFERLTFEEVFSGVQELTADGADAPSVTIWTGSTGDVHLAGMRIRRSIDDDGELVIFLDPVQLNAHSFQDRAAAPEATHEH